MSNFDAFTAAARGDVMIPHVKAAIDNALSNKLIAVGYIWRSAKVVGVGTKAGLFGYHNYRCILRKACAALKAEIC